MKHNIDNLLVKAVNDKKYDELKERIKNATKEELEISIKGKTFLQLLSENLTTPELEDRPRTTRRIVRQNLKYAVKETKKLASDVISTLSSTLSYYTSGRVGGSPPKNTLMESTKDLADEFEVIPEKEYDNIKECIQLVLEKIKVSELTREDSNGKTAFEVLFEHDTKVDIFFLLLKKEILSELTAVKNKINEKIADPEFIDNFIVLALNKLTSKNNEKKTVIVNNQKIEMTVPNPEDCYEFWYIKEVYSKSKFPEIDFLENIINSNVYIIKEFFANNQNAKDILVNLKTLQNELSDNISTETMESFVELGVCPNTVLPNGNSLLIEAVINQRLDFVKRLIELGSKVNVVKDKDRARVTNNKKSVLFHALAVDNDTKFEILKTLLDNGADLKIFDENDIEYFGQKKKVFVPVIFRICESSEEYLPHVLKAILDNKFKPNLLSKSTELEQNILHNAAQNLKDYVLKALLDSNVNFDINLGDKFGNTALHLAVNSIALKCNSLENKLLNSESEMDSNEKELREANLTLDILLKSPGININSTNNSKQTALDLCMIWVRDYTSLVKNDKIPVNLSIKKIPFENMIFTFDSKIIHKLLQNNARSNNIKTDLYLAIYAGHVEKVKEFAKNFKFGSDKDKEVGYIALLYAARYNRKDILSFLRSQGAQVKIDGKDSVLHHLILEGNEKGVRNIIAHFSPLHEDLMYAETLLKTKDLKENLKVRYIKIRNLISNKFKEANSLLESSFGEEVNKEDQVRILEQSNSGINANQVKGNVTSANNNGSDYPALSSKANNNKTQAVATGNNGSHRGHTEIKASQTSTGKKGVNGL
ncbi:MAG: ankyrin repeat domain-containing protein [Sphingobacteriia bacterium]|nr:ankyrin repeat domain-containing protein [Sphingobacteriia bacterium]